MNSAAHLLETLDTAKIRQRDHESALDDFGTHLTQQLDRRLRGPPCRDQVVHQQDLLTRFDRTDMQLDPILPVFEIEIATDRLARKLPGFPHRNEPDAELVGDRGPEDEAPGFDPDDEVDLGRRHVRATIAVSIGDSVYCEPQTLRIEQKRRDVTKLDAWLRVVWDGANE